MWSFFHHIQSNTHTLIDPLPSMSAHINDEFIPEFCGNHYILFSTEPWKGHGVKISRNISRGHEIVSCGHYIVTRGDDLF